MGTELENINALQNKDLGGHNPKKAAQPEEDDNYKIEIDIKKIYEVLLLKFICSIFDLFSNFNVWIFDGVFRNSVNISRMARWKKRKMI